jgi:protein-disulfide isomerase
MPPIRHLPRALASLGSLGDTFALLTGLDFKHVWDSQAVCVSCNSEEMQMKIRTVIVFIAIVAFGGTLFSQSRGQRATSPGSEALPVGLTPAAAAALEKRVEAYLRNIYAWGSAFEVKVGPITAGPANFYSLAVTVSKRGRSESATVYVTKDGQYMFRGDVEDLQVDPLARVREQLHLDGYGSKGPANAKVVVVEFADFECPSCRALDTILRQVVPKYPQVRLVFKDFPLQTVHPWAMTAALASHCVLAKGADAFWKFHDAVYDSQDLITPDNAYDKLTELAASAGLTADSLHACMADPATRQTVEKSIQEGKDLGIEGTPTTFVDGRRIVGPNQDLLEQYLDYDLKSTN